MKVVKIESEYITLTQFLKIEGYIGSGGEAKYFLSDNLVYLNGVIENRRGKKLYPEDEIELFSNKFVLKNENK